MHECATREARRHVPLRHKRQTYAIDRSTDHRLHVIDDKRSFHRDGERLVTLV